MIAIVGLWLGQAWAGERSIADVVKALQADEFWTPSELKRVMASEAVAVADKAKAQRMLAGVEKVLAEFRAMEDSGKAQGMPQEWLVEKWRYCVQEIAPFYNVRLFELTDELNRIDGRFMKLCREGEITNEQRKTLAEAAKAPVVREMDRLRAYCFDRIRLVYTDDEWAARVKAGLATATNPYEAAK